MARARVDEVATKSAADAAALREKLDALEKQASEARTVADAVDAAVAALKAATTKCESDIGELRAQCTATAADVRAASEAAASAASAAAAAQTASAGGAAGGADAVKTATELSARVDTIDKSLTDVVLQGSRQRDSVTELAAKVAELERGVRSAAASRVVSPVTTGADVSGGGGGAGAVKTASGTASPQTKSPVPEQQASYDENFEASS